MVQSIGILGSTGSIGTQTLNVVRQINGTCEEKIKIMVLTAGKNINLLEEQAREFKVPFVCIEDENDAKYLRAKLQDTKTEVFWGDKGLIQAASVDMDMLITAIVGMKGLLPTLKAIDQGIDIGLANKETMVVGGEIVTRAACEKKVRILPVDSEHSAIFQCLQGNRRRDVEKIILTASGGPFRTWDKEKLNKVTLENALSHPTWKMGGKITIDCASMMNKGLEVIEAHWLFNISYSKIEVVVHPQSIVHSMVQYKDGAVMAQLGTPDMKIPIQLALTFPERIGPGYERLDFTKIDALTFEKPDLEKFPCLRLAYDAASVGGTMTTVMNGANEVAVDCFMKGHINFMSIPYIIEKTMSAHTSISNPLVEEILEADKFARKFAGGLL